MHYILEKNTASHKKYQITLGNHPLRLQFVLKFQEKLWLPGVQRAHVTLNSSDLFSKPVLSILKIKNT